MINRTLIIFANLKLNRYSQVPIFILLYCLYMYILPFHTSQASKILTNFNTLWIWSFVVKQIGYFNWHSIKMKSVLFEVKRSRSLFYKWKFGVIDNPWFINKQRPRSTEKHEYCMKSYKIHSLQIWSIIERWFGSSNEFICIELSSMNQLKWFLITIYLHP